jgi:hypothetical protein
MVRLRMGSSCCIATKEDDGRLDDDGMEEDEERMDDGMEEDDERMDDGMEEDDERMDDGMEEDDERMDDGMEEEEGEEGVVGDSFSSFRFFPPRSSTSPPNASLFLLSSILFLFEAALPSLTLSL